MDDLFPPILLDNEYSKMKAVVTKQINESTDLHLQCDGWSNMRNESIINFVISQPKPFFAEFIEVGCQSHTAEYLSNEIGKVIDRYRAEKFFGATKIPSYCSIGLSFTFIAFVVWGHIELSINDKIDVFCLFNIELKKKKKKATNYLLCCRRFKKKKELTRH